MSTYWVCWVVLLSQNCLQFLFWLQRLFLPQVLLKILLPTPIFSWFFSLLLLPPCFWGHANLSNPWRRLKTYVKFAAVIWSLVQKKPPKVVYGLSGISVYLSSLYRSRKMYHIYLKFRLCGTGTVFFSSGVPEFGTSLEFNCLPGCVF